MIRELAETLRQPEYTGENRCLPCTVVNVFIAAVVGSVVSKRSRAAAAFVVAGSLVSIYLRGYLVPGTPELTKRYLPPAVLRWFGKEPEIELASGLGASAPSTAGGGSTAGTGRSENGTEVDGSGVDRSPDTPRVDTDAAVDDGPEDDSGVDDADEPTVPDDLEGYLSRAGILEPCEDRDDLCLSSAFETEWIESIDGTIESGVDTETAVEAFGFDGSEPFELEKTKEGAYALRYGEIGEGAAYNAGMWPSYAALVADVAASVPLASWLDEWDEYGPQQKGQLLNGLRMFLETCPTAEGGVTMTEETVKSCCSSSTVFAVVCEETGERLFEHQLPD